MGLVKKGVTILDFDHSIESQQWLMKIPHETIELNDIPSTKKFCDWNALQQIRSRLSKRGQRGITFVGSGDYHYVSYALLSEIEQPFSLILFDNHSDMLDSPSQNLLSCGSWVNNALNLPNLKKTVVIGASPISFSNIPESLRPKVAYTPYTSSHTRTLDYIHTTTSITSQGIHRAMRTILSLIPTKNIYISIDKDVLNQKEVLTNWDQGQMTLTELLTALEILIRKKSVCGVDVCGEMTADPLERFKPEKKLYIEKNEHANLKILQTCLDHVS